MNKSTSKQNFFKKSMVTIEFRTNMCYNIAYFLIRSEILMNYTNNMNDHYESNITGIDIDYERNKKFFDRKRRKKMSTFYAVSAACAGVGGLMVVLAMYFSIFFFYIPGWSLLITGAVLVCVALAYIIKESDVTDIFEVKKGQFDDICGEKIDFPDDMQSMSMSFLGCNVTTENIDTMYKLKSGQYIDSEIVMTFVYVDQKKRRLVIGCETFSLVENKDDIRFAELSYDDFDKAEIVSDKIDDNLSLYRTVISKDGKTVFDFPFSDFDYSKEEFVGKLSHYKELRRI